MAFSTTFRSVSQSGAQSLLPRRGGDQELTVPPMMQHQEMLWVDVVVHDVFLAWAVEGDSGQVISSDIGRRCGNARPAPRQRRDCCQAEQAQQPGAVGDTVAGAATWTGIAIGGHGGSSLGVGRPSGRRRLVSPR
jgi:hypothetical protein